MLLAREEARVKGYLPENSPLFQTTVSRNTEMNSTVAKEGMSTEGLLRFCALDDRHMMTVNLGSLNYGLCLFATIILVSVSAELKMQHSVGPKGE